SRALFLFHTHTLMHAHTHTCTHACVRLSSLFPLTAPTRVLLCFVPTVNHTGLFKKSKLLLAMLRLKKQSTIIPGYVSHSVLWHIQSLTTHHNLVFPFFSCAL